jgi:hypothetical protein
MTLYEIEKAISDYLKTNWTYTSIRLINKDDTILVPFIECYFKPGIISSLEIQGAGERVGVFIINIYTKKGVGVQQGNSYGGKLESLFWHKTISGVTCESDYILPYTKYIGIDAALNACHHQTIIPFSVIVESL